MNNDFSKYTSSDFGTKERAMHEDGLVKESAETTKSKKVISQRSRAQYPSSLFWYYKKGTISETMLEAGKIFAQLFYKASLHNSPQSCLKNPVKYDRSTTSPSWSAENSEGARRKIMQCYDILTPLEQDVVRNVAGLDERASGEKRVLALKTSLRALIVKFKIPI